MKYFTIIGVPGSGKTTLAKYLSKIMEIKLFKEKTEDSDFLPLFYKNTKKYAYFAETGILMDRVEQYNNMIEYNKDSIQDRSVYEDIIFIDNLYNNNLLSNIEHKTLKRLYKYITNNIKKPEYGIYLAISPETAIKRINKRDRKMEKNISKDYIKSLVILYDKFYETYSKIFPIIKIRWDNDSTNI